MNLLLLSKKHYSMWYYLLPLLVIWLWRTFQPLFMTTDHTYTSINTHKHTHKYTHTHMFFYCSCMFHMVPVWIPICGKLKPGLWLYSWVWTMLLFSDNLTAIPFLFFGVCSSVSIHLLSLYVCLLVFNWFEHACLVFVVSLVYVLFCVSICFDS